MKKIRLEDIMEALDVILGNHASGFYTYEELKKIREDEKAQNRLAVQVVEQLTVNIRDTEEYKTAKWWKKFYLLAHDAICNNRAECTIPKDVLRDLARTLLPHILAMYQTEEGKKQLAEWKKEQQEQKESLETVSNAKSEGN